MYNLIPNESQKEIMRRYNVVKPIINIEGIFYWLREFSNLELSNKAYTWDIKTKELIFVDTDNLIAIPNSDFRCLHSVKNSDPMRFKPTISEVLSQMPIGMLKIANAFEIFDVSEEFVEVKDSNGDVDMYHISTVRLYKKIFPK